MRKVFENRIEYHNEEGYLHREDGPAIQSIDGFEEEWCLNGKIHREDGPARILAGNKFWYINGIRHRSDGPAIELRDGTKEYYFNGSSYSFEEWEQVIKFKAFI